MIPRLYFDTSVFGGVYDEEFEETSTLLFESWDRLFVFIQIYQKLNFKMHHKKSEIFLKAYQKKIYNSLK